MLAAVANIPGVAANASISRPQPGRLTYEDVQNQVFFWRLIYIPFSCIFYQAKALATAMCNAERWTSFRGLNCGPLSDRVWAE